MSKDIFIDNNVTRHFKSPMSPGYDELYQWLILNDELNPENNAFIVLSHKLLTEYNRSNQNASQAPNILYLVSLLQRQGRFTLIKNNAIKDFKSVHFTKKV